MAFPFARAKELMGQDGFDAIICFDPIAILLFTCFSSTVEWHPWRPLMAVVPNSERHEVALLMPESQWNCARKTPGPRRDYTYGERGGENSKGGTWEEALVRILQEYRLSFDKKIGLDLGYLPAARYEEVRLTFRYTLLQDASPLITLVTRYGDINASPLLNRCRDIKDASQIVNAGVAAEMAYVFFDAAEKALLAGKTEVEAYVIGCIAKNDLWGKRYQAVVISVPGWSSGSVSDGFSFSVFPGSHKRNSGGYPTDRKLEDGEVVTLRMIAIANGMHAELRRIVRMGMSSPELAKKIDDLRGFHAQVLGSLKPGVACKSVHEAACEHRRARGYGEDLPASVGHGIGFMPKEHLLLDGVTRAELREGMLILVKSRIKTPGGSIQLADTVEINLSGHRSIFKMAT